MAEIKIRMPPGVAAAVELDEFPGRAATNKVSQDPSPVHHGGQTPLVNDAAFKNAKTKAWISSLRQQTPLAQKLVAEVISTFILVFTGCGSAMVNEISSGQVTHVGVSLAFGLVITIMIYAVGHISGAHMNPAVTLAFAIARHFPWTQVPVYIIAQCGGSIMASFCLRWILHPAASEGATLPAGSDVQSFLLEIIITFILMFVVAAVATDTRACGELAGIAVGSAVALNALMAGPISGASMNPARSLGPAVASGNYRALWVYWAGPIIGAVTGMLAYNVIRLPDKEGDCCNNNNNKPAKSFRR
jgi:aquaporin NIP